MLAKKYKMRKALIKRIEKIIEMMMMMIMVMMMIL
jgi:hypothetical protein